MVLALSDDVSVPLLSTKSVGSEDVVESVPNVSVTRRYGARILIASLIAVLLGIYYLVPGHIKVVCHSPLCKMVT